jgi:hypothetical protein
VSELVFIVGSLHSGANWVFEFLANHPSFTGIRDPWTLYDERQTVERVRAAGDALFDGATTPLVVVRSVASIFMVDELAEAWPQARFVHVMRDGRDAVVRIRIGRYNVDERAARLYGTKISESAAAWAQAVEAGLDAEAKLGDRMTRIRFEHVLRDRLSAATELLSFLGLDPDTALISEILERDEGRLKRPEPQEAWRAYFSVYRALTFNRAAGDTLRRAGYERDPKWWWRPILR